ncbi:archaellin/type IV pilin N-terminal domain-containing protein [Natronococcus sp. A-GB7]|uniref:archaellin/type IV pilin N-terminal domain-containing protein n=1 Tax=Natronococcus sp. A-GB7 TaxID=3037649 RepID=UPI00241CE292|nr:archaellin/type IV pilin N-terminal domain-containing protein [Natronococcus sp. A-GB7]MDG5819054.1 flagellin [Natronococcus sp. A-GB7]
MFETIANDDNRGQVGIGTLIVFIAMVLVAAIAAGVLINTAGSLQSQASDTGTETQQAVANQIEVVHAYAEDTDDEGDFDDLNLIVKKSAGSDVIDMESVTVQYTDSDDSLTLAHGEGFTTEAGTDDSDADALTETSDRIELQIDFDDADVETDALEPGDSATVMLVDQSGAQFSYGVTMPQTVSDSQTIADV